MRPNPRAFYLPEDPDYTIVDSALDSVRFLFHVSELDENGGLYCRSVDASPVGLEPYRDRYMEGVGYCADSVFGAHNLVRLGRVIGRPEFEMRGWSYLDHALETGFFDDEVVPVRLYRDTDTGEFLDNLEARIGYVEHGHIARVGHQLLLISELDGDDERRERTRHFAERIARWIDSSQRCENGWFPRRSTPTGEVFPYAVDALGPTDLQTIEYPDPIFDKSGGGSLALHFLIATTASGLYDAIDSVTSGLEAFVAGGGFFGSVNTDTEDTSENVSYALAFMALSAASDLTGNSTLLDTAYELCLSELNRFEIVSDLNGCLTKGLLFMEDSWNAACTWEMAMCASAYLEAYGRGFGRSALLKALTIMRGLSKHHHGEFGFLTEAVDWDGHSTKNRHLDRQQRGDIRTTHPFLNNLHVLEPTVRMLEDFSVAKQTNGVTDLYDIEGNRLCSVPAPQAPWMNSVMLES